MLPPPAQLKVDKFPHHEGLSEADGGQDSYPKRERGETVSNSKTPPSNSRSQSSPIWSDKV